MKKINSAKINNSIKEIKSLVVKFIKDSVTKMSNRITTASITQRLIIVALIYTILVFISLFFYKPLLSNYYWKMAVQVSSTDFDKALEYIDKSYDLTHEEFLKDVKVSFYINESRKVMKSDPDKALFLLETCYKIKQNNDARDLIFSICTDMANSFYDTDIEKCIYYINKGLSYGSDDSLIALSQKAYAKIAELKNSNNPLDISNNNQSQNSAQGKLENPTSAENGISPEVPKEPDKIVLLYLNAVATGIEADITKFEFTGDRYDLYFYERDLTPKKFILKGSPLNIVKMDDISALYDAPDNEKFFSVVYKNNEIDTLIYVLLVNDAGTWKVYGIV